MRRSSLSPLLLAALVVAPALTAQAPAGRSITVQAMLERPTHGAYRIAPDGERILFTRTDRDPKDWAATSHIWLHERASGRSFQLTNSPRGEANPQFLPDGRVTFTSNRDGRNAWYVIDPRGGEATLLVEGGDSLPSGGSFSRDGTKLVFTQQTERPDKKEWDERVRKRDDGYYAEQKLTWTHVWLYDLTAKKKTQLTSGETDNTGPAISPDNRLVAFSSNRTGRGVRDADWSNDSDIYVVDAAGGTPRQLTTHPGPDNGPVFSPDGRWIAYSSSEHVNNNADQLDVKVISVDGGAPRNLTAAFDYSISDIVWSPDGTRIYFTAAEGLFSHLYVVPAAGGMPQRVSFGEGFVFSDMSWTADGRTWLVTGGSLLEPGLVYRSGADGARPERLFAEHDRMDGFTLARADTLSWKGADGWDIEGIITYPHGYQAGTRYPMILQVHGGPHGRFAATFNQSAQIWASRGYVVLQGNPRGSSGRTFAFSNANRNDWGGKDYVDLMRGVDQVIARGIADPERLAIMGGSYGGFMTFWAITQTTRFKAAIGHAGISDWYSFFGQTDIPNLLEFGFGGLPTQSKKTYEKWSPVEYATKVTTPLLITHGENDLRVPIPQADQYYRVLKKLGKPVEFLRYPREGHGITEPVHRLHLDREQEQWMARHVLGRPAAQ
jgi:dipeptidyl aminopeptidase/acylaminoacyl peptidase